MVETRIVEIEFRVKNEADMINALHRANEEKKKIAEQNKAEAAAAKASAKAQTDAEKAKNKAIADMVKNRYALEREERARDLAAFKASQAQVRRDIMARAKAEKDAAREAVRAEKERQAALSKTKSISDQLFAGWRGRFSEFLIVQATLSKIGQALGTAKSYMDDIVGAGSQQDTATARLNAALANQGEYSQRTAAALDDYASSLQRSIALADDMTQSIQTQILALTDLPAKYLPEATKAVIEISKVTGKDYPSAALQFSKALEGNFQGLAKFGVHIDKAKLKGTDLQKQLQIMRTVVDQLSAGWDIAQAEADNYAGKQKILSEGTGELKERLAALVTHNPAVVTAMDAVATAIWGVVDGIDAFMRSNPEAMATLMQTIGSSFLTAASGIEKFAYAVGYSTISTQMMAADIRERNAANATNQWTDALNSPAAKNNKQSWYEIKTKQNDAYKAYERAKKDRENLDASYKALTEGHADFQQTIATGKFGISKLKPSDFNWNPQVHGAPGGQPEYDDGAGGKQKKGPRDWSWLYALLGSASGWSGQGMMSRIKHQFGMTGAAYAATHPYTDASAAIESQLPAVRPLGYNENYQMLGNMSIKNLLLGAPGGWGGGAASLWGDAGKAGVMAAAMGAARGIKSPVAGLAQIAAKLARRDRFGGYVLQGMQALQSGGIGGLMNEAGQTIGAHLGPQFLASTFGSAAGPIGAILGGGIMRTLRGLGKRIFGGGHHDRGSTPSFPLYTRDVEMGNLLGEMVNLTKAMLVRGVGGGMGSLFSQLRLQQTALGVR